MADLGFLVSPHFFTFHAANSIQFRFRCISGKGSLCFLTWKPGNRETGDGGSKVVNSENATPFGED